MTEFLISGIPAGGAQPCGNKVLAGCADCGGGVWVSPQLQEAREAMASAGRPFRVLCPACAASGDCDDD